MALDFLRIAAAALASAETLVPRWLPGGKRAGREWKCGNLQGEAGNSCSINLDSGQWADFATGEVGGDLVSLYAAVQRISQADAARALADQLGVAIEATGGTSSARPSLKVASRSEWTPIVPVPEQAGPPPVAHLARGKPTHRWEYRDREGRLLGCVYRFTKSDGGKEVLPCVFAEHAKGQREWRFLAFPSPRPLYGLDALKPEGTVLVVEGEKCADAAREHMPTSWSVLTWSGGSKAIDKTDWTPIKGRKVLVWPDCDEPGIAAARKLVGILEPLGCAVRALDVPLGSRPAGWDVADAVAEGLVGAQLRQWILEQVPAEAPTPATAGGIVEDAALAAWQRSLIRNGNGVRVDCRENVMLTVMGHPQLAGLVALNDFAGRAEKRRAPPWGGPAGEWSPHDDRELGLWLAQQCGLLIKSEANLGAGVEMAASRSAWHPVRDWLRGCKGDELERIDHWMVECLGAEPTEYVRRVSRLMLLQMVARVMKPGCKADHMPILEGPQGKGKSSALRALADPWFSDAPFRVGDKDSFLQLAGVWLYEISEMDAFNRSEVTAVKAFVSQITDRFREPYGRRVIARARQTVLAGTTNQDAYLRDLTGNRRFWPVRVGSRIDIEKLQQWREPLFAEALRAFESGEPWWPGRAEEMEHFVPQQDARTIEDPWREILEAWVDDPEQRMRADVTTVELLQGALKVPSERIDSTGQMAKRVVASMTALGWKQKRTTRPNGSHVRAWHRPDRADAAGQEAQDEVPL